MVSLHIKVGVAWPGYQQHSPWDLNASLAGLVGLVVGIYMFLRKGFQRGQSQTAS
jgi:hypothetical protein